MPMEAMFPALVERLIDMRLVAQEARASGLADDPDVKRELAQIENQIISQVYLTRHIDAMITEEAVVARYDEHIAGLPPVEEISARHILLETEEDALAVIASLQGGADFIELAAEKSIGPRPTGAATSVFSVATTWCLSSPTPPSRSSRGKFPRRLCRANSAGTSSRSTSDARRRRRHWKRCASSSSAKFRKS